MVYSKSVYFPLKNMLELGRGWVDSSRWYNSPIEKFCNNSLTAKQFCQWTIFNGIKIEFEFNQFAFAALQLDDIFFIELKVFCACTIIRFFCCKNEIAKTKVYHPLECMCLREMLRTKNIRNITIRNIDWKSVVLMHAMHVIWPQSF